MNKIIKQILFTVILIAILILPYFVFAEDSAPLNKLKDIGVEKGPYAEADEFTVSKIVGTVINAFLGLLGLIFIILMIYAGHLWMNARGDEEQITKAKTTLRRAIVGLIIIIGAFAIWELILYEIIRGD